MKTYVNNPGVYSPNETRFCIVQSRGRSLACNCRNLWKWILEGQENREQRTERIVLNKDGVGFGRDESTPNCERMGPLC